MFRIAPFRLAGVSVLVSICALAPGCRPNDQAARPAIAFTVVPQAAPGGTADLASISGRVDGARPGNRIVLFARSGVWWVQPFALRPYTEIAGDATWTSSIHLGTDYGALLVESGYQPPATIDRLPDPGGPVLAVATVKGRGNFVAEPPRKLTFSGYEWQVRGTASDRGGGNAYAPDNAWTAPDGSLHLKLALRDGRWTSAEVALTSALGYGTYAFVIRESSHLDAAAAMGLLTWDDEGADQNHRELGIEISRWGDRTGTNAQYVVQPYYVAANVLRFNAPPGRLTHSFRWAPGRAVFRTVRGPTLTNAAPAVAEHEFTSGIPLPGNERVHMNLYYFRYADVAPERDVEVVIERFQYFP
jgi:hypothetical protein